MNLNKTIANIFSSLIFLAFLSLPVPAQAGMDDYCVRPPFLTQDIPPSVLIVFDNSVSMCNQAYAGSYYPDQFANKLYYGYFDGSKNYKYTGNGRWEETTDAMTTGTVANPIANGSFLNWATMRRIEVAKKLLIGGRAEPRSPSPGQTVKLNGEKQCESNFEKDFDTSAGNLIYPFVGKYRFKRTDDYLSVISLSPGSNSFDIYPQADISVPAGWTEYPAVGSVIAYTKVDETPSDDDETYIQNDNTTNPVIMDYDDDSPHSRPAGIITVTVKVKAKKTATGGARGIKGVLRINGVNYVSNTSSLSTDWATYSFTWEKNPETGNPWDWSDIKSSASGTLGSAAIQGFGVQAADNYTSKYPRITQAYLNVSVASSTGGPFNTIVDMGSKNATGIIDSLSDNVRFGLAYYNNEEGGKIDTYVDFGTRTNMIANLGTLVPSAWSPLGETLYEMIRYFRQEEPYYFSNSPADYKTGLSYDPYWYKFSSTTDYDLTDRYVRCSKAFILFLTDGESTKDTNIPGSGSGTCDLDNINGCSSGYRFAGTAVGTTYADAGTDYMIDAAFWGRTSDARPGSCAVVPTSWDPGRCIPGTQNIILYPVYMFGQGSKLLKDAAIAGGFKDMNENDLPDCNSNPSECYKDSNSTGTVSATSGVCSNNKAVSCTSDANCASPGACIFDDPITYYEGDDGYALEVKIREAIADILRRVTSGTAASVLASSEGSGANLLQATYYPERQFGSQSISWIGSMQNLWYYADPYFTNSGIREEGGTTKDFILDLRADGSSETRKDYFTQLYYDADEKKAKARRFMDADGDGGADSQLDEIEFEKLGSLWNAGSLLWSRNLSTSPRTIKTWLDKNNDGKVDTAEFIDFSVVSYNALASANQALLRTVLQTADDDAAKKTINYVHGYDKFCTGTSTGCTKDPDCVSPATCSDSEFRSRTVSIDLNGDGDLSDTGEEAKVWKLGDIISSTPKIVSWVKLNGYDETYKDTSYYDFVNDTGSTLSEDSTARYKNRGMVFVGANDGMLHAFKLGTLELKWTGQDETYQKARLSGSDLGKEIWAYVPKNTLPYLNYMQDPSYCHIYSVDLAPFIFDASIGKPATCTETNYWDCAKTKDSWRTVLIGGMQYGGACKDIAYSGAQGVKVPLTGQGYSSYFALDITDPYNPKLLWEFSDPKLGFTTSGPAIVRISARTPSGGGSTADTSKNGRWFVVFGSGPTGGIDTSSQQFLGNSDQNLSLFVLDLKTGSIAATIDTHINNAFAGSLLNSTQDVVDAYTGKDYQDDVVYIPYVRQCVSGDSSATCDSSAGKWNNGGVLRLLTNEDLSGGNVTESGNTALNPNNWKVGKVIDDAGPVTASVAHLQNNTTGKLWIYFGAGRFYYKFKNTMDDADHVRFLYGLKDPCFVNGAFLASCLDGSAPLSYTPGQLAPVDLTTSEGVTDDEGWKISLDGCLTSDGAQVACSDPSVYYKTERVITNPQATSTGIVSFTTLTPYDDICSSGGNTLMWSVKYDTGGALGSRGTALIQTSTSAIDQLNMATAFTEKGGRRSPFILGISQGSPSIRMPPNPVRKILHIQER